MSSFLQYAFGAFALAEAALAIAVRYNVSNPTDSSDTPPLRVYMHVPKCAGTTFSNAMLEASHTPGWWPTDTAASGCGRNEDEGGLAIHCGLSELETCVQSGKACYTDKKPIALGQHFCPALVSASAPLRYIMMIRDPIQRVLSEYYFMKVYIALADASTFNHLIGTKLWTPSVREIAATAGPMEWVQAPGNPAHNMMTKFVVDGDAGLQAPVLRQKGGRTSSCAFFDHDDYVSHWTKYYGGNVGSDLEATINSDKRLLSLAVQNIETRFDFVGLVEHFDESISRAAAILGIHPNTRPTTDHHSRGKPSEDVVDSGLMQEIRARNLLDAGLYQAVLKSKFWKGSAAATKALQEGDVNQRLTWQTIVEETREGAVFDPSHLLPQKS